MEARCSCAVCGAELGGHQAPAPAPRESESQPLPTGGAAVSLVKLLAEKSGWTAAWENTEQGSEGNWTSVLRVSGRDVPEQLRGRGSHRRKQPAIQLASAEWLALFAQAGGQLRYDTSRGRRGRAAADPGSRPPYRRPRRERARTTEPDLPRPYPAAERTAKDAAKATTSGWAG